jgi:hypothetical protein
VWVWVCGCGCMVWGVGVGSECGCMRVWVCGFMGVGVWGVVYMVRGAVFRVLGGKRSEVRLIGGEDSRRSTVQQRNESMHL